MVERKNKVPQFNALGDNYNYGPESMPIDSGIYLQRLRDEILKADLKLESLLPKQESQQPTIEGDFQQADYEEIDEADLQALPDINVFYSGTWKELKALAFKSKEEIINKVKESGSLIARTDKELAELLEGYPELRSFIDNEWKSLKRVLET